MAGPAGRRIHNPEAPDLAGRPGSTGLVGTAIAALGRPPETLYAAPWFLGEFTAGRSFLLGDAAKGCKPWISMREVLMREPPSSPHFLSPRNTLAMASAMGVTIGISLHNPLVLCVGAMLGVALALAFVHASGLLKGIQ